MQLTRWKLVAGGAVLVGLTAGGIAAANDDGFDLNDRRSAIDLNDGSPVVGLSFDDSPESADSPNESVEESADSPFDSPDDTGPVDDSPESADSPDDTPEGGPSPDSPDSADSD